MKFLLFNLLLFSIFLLNFDILYSREGEKKISKEREYELLSKEIEEYRINSPLILNDRIIFFYRGTGEEKKVVVGGDFTHWKPLLLMKKESTNMWQFVWRERLKKGRYRYRYMVDDIWVNDPENTNFLVDNFGEKISYFDLEEDFIPEKTNPLWIEGDIYEFRYVDTDAKFVSLVGNFNNWNPYKHVLEYKGGGEFKIRIRLKPGIYVYCFVVDDEWVPDPENLKQYRDSAGNIVSIFYVDKK